jgi:hypothetical protein
MVSAQKSQDVFPFRFAEVPTQAPLQLLDESVEKPSHLIIRWSKGPLPESFNPKEAHFLGQRSYIVNAQSLPLDQYVSAGKIDAWSPYAFDYKVHPDLQRENDIDRLEVVLDKSYTYAEWSEAFTRQAIPVEKYHPGSHFIVVENTPGRVDRLKLMSEVLFIHSGGRWTEPEDLRAKRLHTSDQLESPDNGGLGFDGTGINVQVRDDGMVGPHLDLKGRLINDPSLPFDTAGTHGDGVAGVLAGAGNIEGEGRGMAPGATVFATQYEASFLDNTLDLHIEEDVLYTNSSYSNGCNDGYTPNAAEVDRQIHTYSSYLHIFSAGNSNNNDCGYGAGSRWGNITGGHKQAKNAIATANVNFEGEIVNSSSRGPATDGRIKPDIAANGASNYSLRPNNNYAPFGGTSGAAPCVAGVLAQLNHAFRDQYGADAPSALLKASLLNGARDVGEPGPDFIYGFGLLDAFNSYEILSQQQFFSENVFQDQSKEFTIDVPAGVDQLKILLYWADPPAVPMAEKALVNDLDLLVDWKGDSYQPLVLDHTPRSSSLSRPAEPGIDRLNNMEQVVIDVNESGQAIISVQGFEVNFASQDFHLVYSFSQNEANFKFLAPQPNQILDLGSRVRVAWEKMEGSTSGKTVSYSRDGGQTWVEQSVFGPFDFEFINLVDPEPQNGDSLLIAYSDTEFTDTLDGPVYFADPHQPDEIEIISSCIDSVTLSWSAKANAVEYQLYSLGEKYIESQLTTTDTFATIPINSAIEQNLFAVRSHYGGNIWSERKVAKHFEGGLFNCPQEVETVLQSVQPQNELLGFTCSPFDLSLVLQLSNNGINPIDSVEVCYQLDDLTPVCEWTTDTIAPDSSLVFLFDSIAYIDRDYNQISAWIRAEGDRFPWNDSIQQDFPVQFLNEDLIQSELNLRFEPGRLPQNTQVINNDDEESWIAFEAIDKRQNESTALVLPAYFYEEVGEVDQFFTPVLNIDSSWTEAEFIFEYAYSPFNLAPDSLYVFALDPCNLEVLDTLWYNGGETMGTANVGFQAFQPSSYSDWDDVRLPIGHLAGRDIILSFTTINGYGNNIWLNRPAIIENDSYIHSVTLNVEPSPVCLDSTAQITAQIDGPYQYQTEWIVPDIPNKLQDSIINYTVSRDRPAAIVSLVSNDFYTHILEDTLDTREGVTLEVVWQREGDTVSLRANTTDADSVFWVSDRGFQFLGQRLTYIGTPGEGIVTFTVTAFGPCGPVTRVVEVDFTVSSQNPTVVDKPIVYPNPSRDGAIFIEHLSNGLAENIHGVRWLNVSGQRVFESRQWTRANGGTIRLNWPTTLSAGYYILDLFDASGNSLHRLKVVRQ